MAFSASCHTHTLELQGSHSEEQQEVQDAAAHPFVEEGHKAVAFRLPRRHVLDHTGVSVEGHHHVSKELQ